MMFDLTDVTYTLRVEPDDTPVRGNAMASGDDEADRKYEDEILERLDRGDVWAWASVCVTAGWTDQDTGETFEGTDYLGACSYDDEAEFKAGGYYQDMRREALDELRRNIEAHVAAERKAKGIERLIEDSRRAVNDRGANKWMNENHVRRLSIGLAMIDGRPTMDTLPECGCYPDGTRPCQSWPECGGPAEV